MYEGKDNQLLASYMMVTLRDVPGWGWVSHLSRYNAFLVYPAYFKKITVAITSEYEDNELVPT